VSLYDTSLTSLKISSKRPSEGPSRGVPFSGRLEPKLVRYLSQCPGHVTSHQSIVTSHKSRHAVLQLKQPRPIPECEPLGCNGRHQERVGHWRLTFGSEAVNVRCSRAFGYHAQPQGSQPRAAESRCKTAEGPGRGYIRGYSTWYPRQRVAPGSTEGASAAQCHPGTYPWPEVVLGSVSDLLKPGNGCSKGG